MSRKVLSCNRLVGETSGYLYADCIIHSGVISMPAGFRRHLVGKTPINVFHCDIAEIRFVGELVIIFVNQRVECNLNNTINLRPLTSHIMPC